MLLAFLAPSPSSFPSCQTRPPPSPANSYRSGASLLAPLVLIGAPAGMFGGDNLAYRIGNNDRRADWLFIVWKHLGLARRNDAIVVDRPGHYAVEGCRGAAGT